MNQGVGKPAWRSKTLIFNGLTIASVMIAAAVNVDLFDGQGVKYLLIVQAGINVALRMTTDSKIEIGASNA